MRFLIVGLGSMGKRRIRNLINLGHYEIYGFDKRKDRLEESKRKYKIKICATLNSLLSVKPDFMIISTSPDSHLDYVKLAVKNKIPFFIEVNTNPKHISQIIKLSKKYKTLGISSMTMRYHPAIKIIKKSLSSGKLGKIYFIDYHSGENLNDWHPWEKLLDYYVKDKKSGGGRDQVVFELEWIFWLFGKPKEVSARVYKISYLPVNIYDTYQMNFKLEHVTLANVLVDVIQRPANRILKIICENGTIIWDWMNGFVKIYNVKSMKWEQFRYNKGYKRFNVEEMYQDELKEVIRSIKRNKNFIQSFQEELIVANSVICAEKSSCVKKTLGI